MQEQEIVFISLVYFFVALVASLIFSAIFRRFRVPWAITLILGGIVLGPHGLRAFEINDNIIFLSEIGVIFLMFLAGMETRFSAIKTIWKKAAFIAFLTGIVPALVGGITALFFGYSLLTSLLLGIILINTSFAVVIPALESRGMLRSPLGKMIISSTMFQDIASLLAFAIFLQFAVPEGGSLPLPVSIVLMFFALGAGVTIKIFIPKLRDILAVYEAEQETNRKENEGLEVNANPKVNSNVLFENELRFVIAIVLGVALIFELLRFEAIVGAFFAGLILSEATQSKTLDSKLHVLGYGIFIPIFFISIGARVDVTLFGHTQIWPLAAAIIFGSMISKYISGWAAGRMVGLNSYESSLVGATSIPQLITTLALTLVGQRAGIIPIELATTLVLLSIVTVIVGPLITNQLLDSPPQGAQGNEQLAHKNN